MIPDHKSRDDIGFSPVQTEDDDLRNKIYELEQLLHKQKKQNFELQEKNNEYVYHLVRINASLWWRLGNYIGEMFSKSSRYVHVQLPKQENTISENKDNIIIVPFGYENKLTVSPRLAVILHAFHVELIIEFYQALKNIPFQFSLFISTDTEEKRLLIDRVFSDWQSGPVDIRIFPNRGRDVAPKFVGFGHVHKEYDFILHLHTKKSPYGHVLAGWRQSILDCLLGSREVVESAFELFFHCPEIGVIAPRTYFAVRKSISWGVNFPNCRKLAGRMGIKLGPKSPVDFPAGSMFWARTEALRPLLDLELGFEDFDEENGQQDGTLAHAIERLVFLSAERQGYTWAHVGQRRDIDALENPFRISAPDQCPAVLSQARRDLLRGA